MAGFYALRYRETIKDPAVLTELDDMVAHFNRQLGKIMDTDGFILPAALVPPLGTSVVDEQHWWRKGPWTFDTDSAHEAFIITPTLAAGTINDFAPRGIDTAFGIEFNLGGNINLTGIKILGARRRILVLRNQSATYTITLKHANTGSQPYNRLSLPASTDIVIGTRQTAWLYYDADNHNWGSFITANTSGGLAGAGTSGVGTGDVVGPASAVNTNIAVFSGTTGKLIADGGQTIAAAIAAASGGAIDTTSDAGIIVHSKYIDLTGAQYKALFSAPVTLIDAPGANKTIQIMTASCEQNLDASSSAYSAAGTILMTYDSATTISVVAGFGTSNPPSGTRYLFIGTKGPAATSFGNGTSVANQAIKARFAAADLTGGSNLGNVQIRIHLTWTIIAALG